MNCQNCGSINTTRKSGISKKTGKQYVGWKCADCNEMTFENNRRNQQESYTAPVENKPIRGANNNGSYDPKTEAMIFAYAKDIVVALLASGVKLETPFKTACDGFKLMLKHYYNPFED